jgi:hypothetical protein
MARQPPQIDPSCASLAIRRSAMASTGTVAPLLCVAVADIRYIYTAVVDGGVRFIIDAADKATTTAMADDQAGLWEVYDDADPTIWTALGRDR